MNNDTHLRVLGISGSLRKTSFNTGLLRAAQEIRVSNVISLLSSPVVLIAMALMMTSLLNRTATRRKRIAESKSGSAAIRSARARRPLEQPRRAAAAAGPLDLTRQARAARSD